MGHRGINGLQSGGSSWYTKKRKLVGIKNTMYLEFCGKREKREEEGRFFGWEYEVFEQDDEFWMKGFFSNYIDRQPKSID